MLRLKSVVLAAFLFLLPHAHAYDVDTHFYGTYAMARYAGIGHEIATKLALSAQWMDESFISDPVSMIFMPVAGVKKRRLLHFPATRYKGSLAPSIEQESFGFGEFTGLRKAVVDYLIKLYGFEGDLRKLVAHSETVENDSFASVLMMEGLREGDLMKAGASLHVLEDSYAHAGTTAEIGHTSFWHWPDRPYFAVSKYVEMTETILKAMVAIRAQLPREALDCTYRSGTGAPNCELNAADLFVMYASNEDLLRTVGTDIMKSFEYIEFVLDSFIDRAVKVGYIRREGLPKGQTFEGLLREVMRKEMFFEGKLDAYQVLEFYVMRLLEMQGRLQGQVLDLEMIPKDMGLIDSPDITFPDYVRSGFARLSGPEPDATGVRPFIKEMVRRVLIGYVPIPLSAYHMVEIENDHAAPRLKEMEMRVRNMRAFVKRQFGVDLEFVPNNTANEEGLALEVAGDAKAAPILPESVSGRVYATFDVAEKQRFAHIIFGYLFPSLDREDLSTLINALVKLKGNMPASIAERYRQERAVIEASDRTFFVKFWLNGISYPREWSEKILSGEEVARTALPMRKLIKRLMKDLANTHIKPVGDERFYQNPQTFEDYKAKVRARDGAGLFPQFLGATDTWKAEAVLSGKVRP